MPAETLKCPMCGAPASTDSPQCEHCGAQLATIACPSCFGMMFIGEKFCSHCGAAAARTEDASGTHELCPRCKTNLQAVVLGKSRLEECPHCEGMWVSADVLQQICADREQQAAVLGMSSSLPASSIDFEKKIHYIPCPVCQDLMNRVNFAHCSNVIVNVCRAHGTWFDRDALRHLVEFIRGGGMEKVRARELNELEDRRKHIEAEETAAAFTTLRPPTDWQEDAAHLGISAVGSLLAAFLRR
ncbi:MAG TPA: zf-TFIIB domain-containing protein [Candidatus Saccharimonadales bacterium]|nr:zf-TFIIB domain-containing protein [Candidatus Saccharimonadales bacterium]